ncbi:MAG: hypothetical protein HON90_01645 [Halobacteriovoraceae bacterium]|jgi:peptide deformylase|nr:hypothetical protein [Halobacteriovoraceae bacterium]
MKLSFLVLFTLIFGAKASQATDVCLQKILQNITNTHVRKPKILVRVSEENPILKKEADEFLQSDIKNFDNHILIEDMAHTLKNSDDITLTAPQVGKDAKVIVTKEGDKIITMINPKVTILGSKVRTTIEGCFTPSEFCHVVRRPKKIKIKYLDKGGIPREIIRENKESYLLHEEIEKLEGVISPMYSRKFPQKFNLKKFKNLDQQEVLKVNKFLGSLEKEEVNIFYRMSDNFEKDIYDLSYPHSLVYSLGKTKKQSLKEILRFYSILSKNNNPTSLAKLLGPWVKSEYHRKFLARHFFEKPTKLNMLAKLKLLSEYKVEVDFDNVNPFIEAIEIYKGQEVKIKTSIVRRNLNKEVPFKDFSTSEDDVFLGMKTTSISHFYMLAKGMRYDADILPFKVDVRKGKKAFLSNGYLVKFNDLSTDEVQKLSQNIQQQKDRLTFRISCVHGVCKLVKDSFNATTSSLDTPVFARKAFESIIEHGFKNESGDEIATEIIRTTERVGTLSDGRKVFTRVDKQGLALSTFAVSIIPTAIGGAATLLYIILED